MAEKRKLPEKHVFEVGKIYRTRLGEYEVLGVDGEQLSVRFLADGERRFLNLPTQTRIWENLQREERDRRRDEAKAAIVVPEPRRLGGDFAGLLAQDFGGKVAGTTWRSKAGLVGGLLVRLKRNFAVSFTSVAVRGWPVVYLGHRPFNDWRAAAEGARVARYTVQADAHGLYFGFYVERVDEECHDWQRLVARLPELETEVAALEAAGVRLEARRGFGAEHSYYWDGPRKGSEPLGRPDAPFAERVKALASPLAEGESRELYVGCSMTPEDAIGKGVGLVEEVGDLFLRLAPLYAAATELPLGTRRKKPGA